MRLLSSSILLGLTGLLPSVVMANGPIVNVNKYDNNNGNVCTVETYLDCTYVENGTQKTCISKKVGPKTYEPWLYVPSDKCNERVTATITMKMCNRNAVNKPIKANRTTKPSFFRFKGNDYVVPDLDNPINKGDCITVVRTEQLQKCKTYPMSVKFEGQMQGVTGNRFCYSFVFNKSRSKKYTTFPQPPVPPQTFVENCQEISDLQNGGQNICNSRVSISCTYPDNNNVRQSCIGPDKDFTFLNVREDLCATLTPLPVTLRFEMCNTNNQNSGLVITNLLKEDPDSTYFRFKGKDYHLHNTNPIPGFGNDLAPQECRSYEVTEQIDTCKRVYPMSVQLEGNMEKSVQGNSYCYCFLFKRALINKIPVPPTLPPTPGTPPPTTPPPTTPPPVTPPPAPSVPLIITEVTDPEEGPNGGSPNRYVKIAKSGPSSSPIIPDLKLVIFEPTGPVWPSAIPVSNWPTNVPGPDYKICNFAENSIPNSGCDLISNTDITNKDGCYTLAIVDGDANSVTYNVYDIFGRVTSNCEGTDADFGGGFAKRKPGFTVPRNPWLPGEWNVEPGVPPATPPPTTAPPVTSPPSPSVPLIITKVTDPEEGPNGGSPNRYVKIAKSGPSSSPIIPDLKLVIFEPTGPVWPTAIPVSNWPTNVPGPDYKICNFAENSIPNSGCDLLTNPTNPITNVKGCYTLAIVDGDANSVTYNVYDIFGRVTSNCEGTDADFGGGFAERKPGFTAPRNPWIPGEWNVEPGRPSNFPAIITEITDPTGGPNPPRSVTIEVLGEPLEPNLSLVVYEPNGPVWNTAIPISDWTPTNGKLYVCNQAASQSTKSGLCNYIPPASNRITNLPGCYNLAIVRGNQGSFTDPTDIVDIFGVKNSSCQGTNADFGGGAATRLPAAKTPRQDWVPGEWVVTSGPGPDELILYITEIADPFNGPESRFIELYSPNKKDYVITPQDNLILVRYTGANSLPDSNPYLNLAGYKIDSNGFLVVCVDDDCYGGSGGKCNYKLGPNSIANVSGQMDVAIMRGPVPGNNQIIDIYGIPGQSTLPSQDFSGGRAIRRTGVNAPNSVCILDNWFVVPGGVPGQTLTCQETDPGCWNGIGDCSGRPVSPTRKPTLAPVMGPSKGKGDPNPSKGKNKRTRRVRRKYAV